MESSLLRKASFLLFVSFSITAVVTVPTPAEQPASATKRDQVTFVRCGALIDEKSEAPRRDALIEIAGGGNSGPSPISPRIS
jgi:hypothetical protein